MRKIIVVALFLLCVALPALAQTPARCGFSFGVMPGIGLMTAEPLREEFPVMWGVNAEVKYYLWKPFALAGDLGFLYAEGDPDKVEWHGEWIDLQGGGISFIRAGTFAALLKIEIGRYWKFNPYVGGGGGAMYNTLERRGTRANKGRSDAYDEWLGHYLALIGFDYTFDQYVALKFEARWTWAPSPDTFVDRQDLGLWFAVLGVQIYL
jgi:hypothetical protein